MVQIKGSAIKETINQIKARSGEDALQKILGLLDEEARTICQGEIYSSTWYPLDIFTRFLEVEIRVLADGREEMITRGSEVVIEKQLRGIYKAFVKLGSPEFVIKRIAAVHETYFQGVPIEVDLQRPGKARFAYDAPTNLVMASNGHLVSVWTQRLKTFESYPLGMTPLSVFLAKEIRLDKGVVVSRVERLGDGFAIVARGVAPLNGGCPASIS